MRGRQCKRGFLIEMIPTGRGGSYVKLKRPLGWEEKQLMTFFVLEVKSWNEVKSFFFFLALSQVINVSKDRL